MPRNNGLADFKRRMAAIPIAAKAAAQPALNQGADEIVRAQKSLAPRDDGTLQGSIRWSVDGELSRKIEAGGPTTSKPVRHGVDAEYDYAIGVEFGTRKSPAQPYFWPGYRLARKRVNARIKRAISKSIKEAFSGK